MEEKPKRKKNKESNIALDSAESVIQELRTINVVLTDNVGHLDILDFGKNESWIILFTEPNDIASIVELNMKVRKINADFLESGNGNIAEIAILDLLRAGFPPLSKQAEIEEFRRILSLYVLRIKEIANLGEVYNFV